LTSTILIAALIAIMLNLGHAPSHGGAEAVEPGNPNGSLKGFSLSARATGLVPGEPRPLVISMDNTTRHNLKLHVRRIVVAKDPHQPACAASLVHPRIEKSGYVIPRGKSVTQKGAITMVMSGMAPDACELARFPIRVLYDIGRAR
jgi:hypothetical protein